MPGSFGLILYIVNVIQWRLDFSIFPSEDVFFFFLEQIGSDLIGLSENANSVLGGSLNLSSAYF